MPQLTNKEQDIFLNEREILMRIAVTRENGSPLVTPIWYLYEKDTIFFTPREKSEWFSFKKNKSSSFNITLGSFPSITATTEFVVPRSIPMIFPIITGPF